MGLDQSVQPVQLATQEPLEIPELQGKPGLWEILVQLVELVQQVSQGPVGPREQLAQLD